MTQVATKNQTEAHIDPFAQIVRDTYGSDSHLTFAGIDFTITPDNGLVIWASDWSAIFDLAYAEGTPFSFRAIKPGTFGHEDVIYRGNVK